MNQSFVEGRRIPVTKLTVGPCTVTDIKNMETDGYWAIQLGFGTKKAKHISKALQGHFKKSQSQDSKIQTFPRYVKEIKLETEPEVKVGDTLNVSEIFKKGDIISVTGTSKGKGFAGGVKRHGFGGGSRTHGQSDRERAPGSIGGTTTPGRVYKGKRMAGRMGTEQTTVKNLQVVSIDTETNQVEVSGPVPGMPGALLVIKKLKEGKLEGIAEVQAQVVEGEAEGETQEDETKAEGEQKAETPKKTVAKEGEATE